MRLCENAMIRRRTTRIVYNILRVDNMYTYMQLLHRIVHCDSHRKHVHKRPFSD